MATHLEPLGDRAFLARFGSERDAAGWAESVRRRRFAGVTDVVLAYDSAAVYADPDRADLAALEDRLRALPPLPEAEAQGRSIAIPVLYDGEDLDEVGRRLGLARAEVVARHSAGEYHVFAIGFLPGFPYAGYLPEKLAGLPRRDAPRARVPAGSVAIVGRQTGVYPQDSPGGWHLIGRTPLRIVDVEAGAFPIRAGDRIRFVPIGPGEFEALRGQVLWTVPST
jgi:KipI family sensor histidine kinase inhibitor